MKTNGNLKHSGFDYWILVFFLKNENAAFLRLQNDLSKGNNFQEVYIFFIKQKHIKDAHTYGTLN